MWSARFLIGLVLAANLQCAAAFILTPERYLTGFGLVGVAGASAVRGMGILFLMWNVPYCVAFYQPVKRKISLYEAVVMQAVGLVGESWLLASILGTPGPLLDALQRFIIFDGAGLLALLLAAWVTRREAV